MTQELARQTVKDGAPALPAAEVPPLLQGLAGWSLTGDGTAIEREFQAKTFLKAQSIATLIGGIAELAGHHPDMSYGWGYCRVRFTTHSAGGISMNDLICAARVNLVLR